MPAERMKSHTEHRVPLSDRAVAIIEEMLTLRSGDFVFPGTRHNRRTRQHDVFGAAAAHASPPPHGARLPQFLPRLGHGARPGSARGNPEAALAHTVKDKTEAAYRRGDLPR